MSSTCMYINIKTSYILKILHTQLEECVINKVTSKTIKEKMANNLPKCE